METELEEKLEGFEVTEEDEEDEESESKNPLSNINATGVLNRIGDILLLHFAVLIGCLPIITIGASLSAGAYVGMKLAAGTEGGVLGNYLKGFKENFKRSTIYFLGGALGCTVVYVSFRYWSAMDGMIGSLMGCMSVCLGVILAMFMLYVFAVQAKFENTLTATAKNAVLMAVRHFHITVLMVFIVAIVVWLFLEFMAAQALLSVTGFGIIFFVLGKLYNIVFKSYI